jgi:FkbM family methyltransferase
MLKKTLRNLLRPALKWYCNIPLLNLSTDSSIKRCMLYWPQRLQYRFRRTCVPCLWKPGYFSQNGQDRVIADIFFPKFQHGCFVDIGAHDGVTASNTCYLERERQWRGLAVEPVPGNFAKLAADRKCQVLQACVAETEGQTEIMVVEGSADVLSGMATHFRREHSARIDREIAQHGGSKSMTRVDCYRLDTLLDRFDIHEIDYLSIDCEGADLAVLRSIAFEKVLIRAITIEEPGFKGFKLLQSHGFQLVAVVGADDVYVHRKFGPLEQAQRIRELTRV